jgi:A/G-specific adenine glycosylase
MDYGASLKRAGISHNARSAAHAKQAKFAGSMREARGAILRALAQGGAAAPAKLTGLLGSDRRAQMRQALRALWAEKLIEKRETGYALMGASGRQ